MGDEKNIVGTPTRRDQNEISGMRVNRRNLNLQPRAVLYLIIHSTAVQTAVDYRTHFAEAAAPSDSLILARRVQLYLLTYLLYILDATLRFVCMFLRKTTIKINFQIPDVLYRSGYLNAFQAIFTLRASCGAVYCNRPYRFVFVFVFVGGSVTTITRNCVHRSSPNCWVLK